jgi:N-acetylglucosamine kinase-like BadF-type ATPase
VLGDEGSGFWIGLEAIKAALKSRAGVIPETALGERIMREFGTQDDRHVIREVYSASFSEAEIAGLVPLVASLSQEGDAAATRILDEAAGHLADIVRAVLRRLGDLAVYPSGGVFRATTMRDRFEQALKRSGNDVEVKDTVNADPLDGVFLIARRGIR